MKKYLSALVLVGLLCSASIAYGTDQPVIDPIKQPATETQATDQVITRAEFTAMLVQKTGYKIDAATDDNFLLTEPIVLEEALDMCSVIVNPFEDDELDTVGLAYDLNLIVEVGDDLKAEALLTPQDAETMIDNLVMILNLKQNEENNQGVSYVLTPSADGYKLELMWGKKPSSGYNIEIEDTKTLGDTLYVKYVTSQPKPGSAYLSVITYPTDSVVLEAKKLPKRVVMINSN